MQISYDKTVHVDIVESMVALTLLTRASSSIAIQRISTVTAVLK